MLAGSHSLELDDFTGAKLYWPPLKAKPK